MSNPHPLPSVLTHSATNLLLRTRPVGKTVRCKLLSWSNCVCGLIFPTQRNTQRALCDGSTSGELRRLLRSGAVISSFRLSLWYVSALLSFCACCADRTSTDVTDETGDVQRSSSPRTSPSSRQRSSATATWYVGSVLEDHVRSDFALGFGC